jgi:chromate transport protein ChrA
MSRTGARRELLRGPFLYGSVIVVATLVYWRRLTAALCISCLCAGDGFADLVGRRFAPLTIQKLKHDDDTKEIRQSEPQQQQQQQQTRGRIPWCQSKSWVGTLGFIGASALTSSCLAAYFQHHGWITVVGGGREGGREGGVMTRRVVWERVWGSTLLSAAAETLPVPEGWDNVLVFLAALLADWLVTRGRGVGL